MSPPDAEYIGKNGLGLYKVGRHGLVYWWAGTEWIRSEWKAGELVDKKQFHKLDKDEDHVKRK